MMLKKYRYHIQFHHLSWSKTTNRSILKKLPEQLSGWCLQKKRKKSTLLLWSEPRREKIGFFAYAKTKTLISFAVTAKLISAFVFATSIVQSLCEIRNFKSLDIFCGCTARFVTWSETPKTGFLTSRLKYSRSCITYNATLPYNWAPAFENQQFGFWPDLTQTRLFIYWRWLEA